MTQWFVRLEGDRLLGKVWLYGDCVIGKVIVLVEMYV